MAESGAASESSVLCSGLQRRAAAGLGSCGLLLQQRTHSRPPLAARLKTQTKAADGRRIDVRRAACSWRQIVNVFDDEIARKRVRYRRQHRCSAVSARSPTRTTVQEGSVGSVDTVTATKQHAARPVGRRRRLRVDGRSENLQGRGRGREKIVGKFVRGEIRTCNRNRRGIPVLLLFLR